MPKYRVKEPAFCGGMQYGPNTKRPYLTIEKPFKKLPSWAELVDESASAEDLPDSEQATLQEALNKELNGEKMQPMDFTGNAAPQPDVDAAPELSPKQKAAATRKANAEAKAAKKAEAAQQPATTEGDAGTEVLS